MTTACDLPGCTSSTQLLGRDAQDAGWLLGLHVERFYRMGRRFDVCPQCATLPLAHIVAALEDAHRRVGLPRSQQPA